MSRKSGNKLFHDINASCEPFDTFGTTFDSMLTSEKYKELSLSAKHFYTVCRNQARSKRSRQCLYKFNKENGTNYDERTHFVFPAAHMVIYGYDRSNGKKFLDELIENGFIIKVEKNNHRHKVNIYAFSNNWYKSS